MPGKLRIERYVPGATDAPDDISESPTPGPEPVPPHTPAGSIRPYFYRVPKGPQPPPGEAPKEQRRSTDDEPTGPRTR
jgi:hypothetical protein